MAIIPLPSKIETRPGEYRLNADTGILADAANAWNANYLHDLLALPTGLPLPVRSGKRVAKNLLRLTLDASLGFLGKEGYRLTVAPEGVTLAAATTAGVFYAIQSLRQLLPPQIERRALVTGIDWVLPAQVITDEPRFAWRGFMLDEGRHFQGPETVLLTLDLMALQKLNILHWHLTEDQGWRIEIKKYPKLTQVGSQRAGTSQTILGPKHDGVAHGGFYTQAQIRTIVAYAAQRHITIVPEIEMPGHSLAALAAYPELSCTGGPFEVATHFGIYQDIYCAGKEAVLAFLENVLDEVMALFPSPYIHIGGDEAPKKRWKTCPDCQKRIREEGLEDEHALQVYLTNRIAAYLESKKRRAVGWNEILQDGLAPGAVVHYWVGDRKRLVEAMRSERRAAVMSTYLDAYLDHSYALMPLSRAYRYEPVPAELDAEAAACILGLEFPLWTEWVPNRARLDYQAYPRLTALAETGWTPRAKKDLAGFRRRLAEFLLRLDELGVRHASLREAEPSWLKQRFGLFTIAQPQTRTAA